MSERKGGRIVAGWPWYNKDASLSMTGKKGALSNPGLVVKLGDRIFIDNGAGKLVIAEGIDVQKARILFQAKK